MYHQVQDCNDNSHIHIEDNPSIQWDSYVAQQVQDHIM
jgi:hypothetical protein